MLLCEQFSCLSKDNKLLLVSKGGGKPLNEALWAIYQEGLHGEALTSYLRGSTFKRQGEEWTRKQEAEDWTRKKEPGDAEPGPLRGNPPSTHSHLASPRAIKYGERIAAQPLNMSIRAMLKGNK
jgi:hypothetical protein